MPDRFQVTKAEEDTVLDYNNDESASGKLLGDILDETLGENRTSRKASGRGGWVNIFHVTLGRLYRRMEADEAYGPAIPSSSGAPNCKSPGCPADTIFRQL